MLSLILTLHIIKKTILDFLNMILSLPIMVIAMISGDMLDTKLQRKKKKVTSDE